MRRNSKIGLLWNSTQLVGRKRIRSALGRIKRGLLRLVAVPQAAKFTQHNAFTQTFSWLWQWSRISILYLPVRFLWDVTAVPNSCIRNDEGRQAQKLGRARFLQHSIMWFETEIFFPYHAEIRKTRAVSAFSSFSTESNPPLSRTEFPQPHSLVWFLGIPLLPSSADVIYGSPFVFPALFLVN